MSEEQENERVPINVALLETSDLDKLSPEQVQYVRNQSMRKRNPKIYDKVMGTLKGLNAQVVESLSRAPFVFITPEIEINGVKVKFRSLWSAQTDDVLLATQKFIASKSATDLVANEHMGKLFLAHGVEHFNGEPPAMSALQDFSWKLEDEAMAKALTEFRNTRMRWLASMPQSLVGVLISANQVFQEFYDDVVNLRSDDGKSGERAQNLVEAVGKSTGPQVAGQSQT